ncbi:MAG: hypothetical protein MUP45_00935 [Candidatus Marinimicrobia bacterium]|nr:hypothetical protein [Candidatus Neomarinimicrobiota bacterium]
MKEKDAAGAESQSKNTPVEHFAPFWTEKTILQSWAILGRMDRSLIFYLISRLMSSKKFGLLVYGGL